MYTLQFGDMLNDARIYHGVGAEAVFHHLLSKSAYYRVEANEMHVNASLFCTLWERFGCG